MARAGLDIEDPQALTAYLRDTGRIAPQERVGIRVLRGGVSNRTVEVRRPGGEAWVLKQALARLRVEVDWFSPPERIAREALGLRFLAAILPPGSVPAFVFEDAENHLLAMTAVPQPHRNWKTMLLAGEIDFDQVGQFAAILARIHCSGQAAEQPFRDRSYFESLRLEPYYEYTASQAAPAAPFLQRLLEDTRACRQALVHGDYSPKNILVHEGRLVLLDHEVIHYGDPAFDLGFSLTHFLSKAHHLPEHRGRFREAAGRYWAAYRSAVPWSEEPRAVRHTLGCLLARVAGRSPLEYLSPEEKRRQRETVVALMADPPASVPHLIDRFVERIHQCP